MAAAIIVIAVLARASFVKAQSKDIPNGLTEAQSNSLQSIAKSESIKGEDQTYKINTQCEILFALTQGKYSDGTSLPRGDIKTLIEKYPEEFKEWKATLEDPEKAKEFSKNVPDKFNEVLIPILMKEASMNPDLKSTAMLLMDPKETQS